MGQIGGVLSPNWGVRYDRTTFDAVVTDYDLEDMYAQPFKRAIQFGGAAGIMW